MGYHEKGLGKDEEGMTSANRIWSGQGLLYKGPTFARFRAIIQYSIFFFSRPDGYREEKRRRSQKTRNNGKTQLQQVAHSKTRVLSHLFLLQLRMSLLRDFVNPVLLQEANKQQQRMEGDVNDA